VNVSGTTSTETIRSQDGTTIAFSRAGDGPALIAVDGAIGHRSLNPAGAPLTSLLAQRFTAITYDRRGRGESGDTAPYSPEREIEDLQALITEVGGSAFVYGISSGAVLALDAAARTIGIAKLALYEPPFIVDDGRPPLPNDYVQRLNDLVSKGRRGDAVEVFMTNAVGLPAEMVGQMRNAPMWPALEAVAHTIAYDGTVMGDTMSGKPLPTRRWAAVTIPTLVMDGGESAAWQKNGVRALVAMLPQAKRRTLDGQTHDVDPNALAPVLKEFFL
jgi:pimeloyl-ACP methyl ester carboxylesterase